MDWDDLRFFLVVARRRTLSAAARELGVTQPTVGRRIAALERQLGARLFVRRPDGFVLSASAARVLEHAEQMECLARVVGDQAAGLQRVPLSPAPPTPTLWLGLHRDARTTPRVRVDASYLTEKLRALEPRLCPVDST